MWEWLKEHYTLIIAGIVTLALIVFLYACEPKVESLQSIGKFVNRQELQLELDTIISRAQLRVADLDQQEKFRAIILQNAMVLVQGQPLNPVGLISGIAAIYGLTQAGCNVTKTVKNVRKKRKVNNGAG